MDSINFMDSIIFLGIFLIDSIYFMFMYFSKKNLISFFFIFKFFKKIPRSPRLVNPTHGPYLGIPVENVSGFQILRQGHEIFENGPPKIHFLKKWAVKKGTESPSEIVLIAIFSFRPKLGREFFFVQNGP